MPDDDLTVFLPPVPLPVPPPRSRQAAAAWAWVNAYGTLALWTWALVDLARALYGLG